jgi:hypothetical protein
VADGRRTELKMTALPAMRINIVPVSYVSGTGGGTVRLGALEANIGRLGMVCLHTHCDAYRWLNGTIAISRPAIMDKAGLGRRHAAGQGNPGVGVLGKPETSGRRRARVTTFPSSLAAADCAGGGPHRMLLVIDR